MLKQASFLLVGASLLCSSIGCCCGGWGYRSNNCGCPPSYYPPAGGPLGYQQSSDASQQFAAAPSTSQAYPTTASLAPVTSLPTY